MKNPYRIVLLLVAVMLLIPSQKTAVAAQYVRTVESYAMPDVTLINQDGKRVKFASLVNSGKPVLVDFIFGTCTTICPVLSAGFVNFQRKLGNRSGEVQLISISIDPENDSPRVMKEYLKNYHARQGWDFLTGSRADIDRVMLAFNAYVQDKMSHLPVMFIKAPGDKKWVRIYGLIGSADFVSEYEKVVRK